MAIGRDGVAYAVGRTRKTVGYGWFTRRSADGGATWSIVDEVGGNYGGRSVAVAGSGRVYTTALRAAGGGGALARTSPTGAAGTWQDTDSFGFAQSGDATGVSVDASGNVYVCGYMEDARGGFNGVIRKLTAPAGPKLSATLSGAQVKLSWPVSATAFVMQARQSFTGSDWQDLPTPPVTNGSQQEITVEMSGPAQFFRLLRP